MQTPANKSSIVNDPEWLAHRYSPSDDAFHFVHAPRDVHRSSIFLNDEYLPGDLQRVVLPRREASTNLSPAPLHFIFHSGFCCSTLLARACDFDGVSMGLKEPVILQDIVGYGRAGAPPDKVDATLKGALDMLARPFGAGESVVVKPSSIVNGMAGTILTLRPESRALFLHAPLPVFLGSIIRKGLWGRLWGRELFLGLRKLGLIDLGFNDEQHFGQTDLQIAAAGWLAQQKLFERFVRHFGPERVRTLDSETLMARPEESMSALARLFQLNLDAGQIRDIVAGPVFGRHSKYGNSFDGRQRAADRREGEAAHSDEIEKVSIWAAKVAEAVGYTDSPLAPLLD